MKVFHKKYFGIMEVRINQEPLRTTHQASLRIFKNRYGQMFIGKKVNTATKTALELIKQDLIDSCPAEPFSEATRLKIVFNFSFLKSHTKKQRELGVLPKTTKPDCDNLAKGLIDLMTQTGYFTDDAIINDLHIIKQYGDTGFIEIEINNTKKGGLF